MRFEPATSRSQGGCSSAELLLTPNLFDLAPWSGSFRWQTDDHFYSYQFISLYNNSSTQALRWNLTTRPLCLGFSSPSKMIPGCPQSKRTPAEKALTLSWPLSSEKNLSKNETNKKGNSFFTAGKFFAKTLFRSSSTFEPLRTFLRKKLKNENFHFYKISATQMLRGCNERWIKLNNKQLTM